jgi:D-serine deaminase-like pyridoxal phosphate-dependent protein
MDHGEPTVEGHTIFFTSDEHAAFVPDPDRRPAVGDRVRMFPAHVDPTVAYHRQMWVLQDDEVVDRWPVDLRNW